ncbi:DHA2 family efflux MFS transporter permease subunit [Alicyclobacillus sp.]|uniref:DHA2 family efflux MFS transporter permease subunit n=1 Tax=Alicyclobacillus sp. TaxID=61169 RepID=UPI0025C139A7|nr:DHA2 family efflux MFS transporter permease subunit [Alicyclobacillus sp.]MCL6516848.1 DHA2 family efflux MFS transporter permease subunit [Alicyclobacillus sp.]
MAEHTPTPARPGQPAPQHVVPVLVTLLLGAFVTILNQTLLNVAIPRLMIDFNESASTVQWLSTAYMMTNGILIPISAFLIATFTTRQLFISAMTFFTVGSVICSIAPNFAVMLIGRIVQAFGAGVIMPLMMTVVLNLFPPERRGGAMGTIGIAMIFAPAVGPTLSGWIIQTWSWRLLFWVVIPFAVVDIILASVLLRNVTERSRPTFDWFGFITSTIAFGALLYGFSDAGNKGWGDGAVRTSIVVGTIALILFIWREMTASEPMLDLRVFRYNMFSLTTVVSCVINVAMFGAMILLPIYVQNIRGFTPLQSGLLMMPGAIVMGIMSPITGKLFDRVGARPLVIFGLIVTIVTTYDFAHLTPTTSYEHLMWLYTARMFGMSFIMMTIMTAGLNQLPRRLNAHGTAAANTARTVAGSLGTAILVTIMSNRTHVHYGLYADRMNALDPGLAATLHQFGSAIASQLGQAAQAGTAILSQMLYGLTMQQATIDAINDSFLVATAITVLALVLSFFIHRVRPADEPASRAGAPGRRSRGPAPKPAPAE